MATTDRKAKTMQLSGNEYAKVAERLRLFRNDFPHSKTESAYEFEPDKSVVFTVWVWKEKSDYVDVLKEVKDAVIARGSADANGTARGEIGAKQKDFEKLETIALGRALAMLGYLASGEIASFEEQKEFEEFRQRQQEQQTAAFIEQVKATKGNPELNKLLQENSGMLKFPNVVEAAKAKQAEFAKSKPTDVNETDQKVDKPKPDVNKKPEPKKSEVSKSVSEVEPKNEKAAPALPLE